MNRPTSLSLLNGLNSEQVKAVTAPNQSTLVIAAPGSGKTTVLTRRIAYLIEKGVSAQSIIGITFSRAAAKEMNKRIRPLLKSPNDSENVYLATFNAFGLSLLQGHFRKLGYVTEKPSLISRSQKSSIFNAIGIKLPDYQSFEEAISKRKCNYQSCLQDGWNDAFRDYQTMLKREGLFEFDDQVVLAIRLLEEHPSLKERIRSLIQSLLIDEFQDSNPAQYRLLKLLAPKNGSIFVVADDAQSIYAFRGASTGIVQQFEKDFDPAKILLEKNYRSSPIFSDMANRLIRHNRNQVPKRITSVRGKEGTFARLYQAASREDEAKDVVHQIKRLIIEGTPPDEICILYRNHALNESLKRTLLEAGIPILVKQEIETSEPRTICGSSISLMTLHAAKGLEWDVVFLIGLEEGSLPFQSMMDSEEAISEERRLCYVGITRPRRFLFLSYVLAEEHKKVPSRFLAEMMEGPNGRA